MAGFGQTAEAQKQVAKVQQVAPAPVMDAFAHLRLEEEKMGQEKMTHMFIGVAGFDGTGKSVSLPQHLMSMSRRTPMQ